MIGKGITGRFKKGKFFIALAVAAVLTVPFTVYAATSDTSTAKNIRGFFGIDSTKLTDQQKETVKTYSQKMVDLQKEFINNMVANGAMTKEQGDAAIKKIEDGLANSGASGFMPGFGMGRNGFEGRGKPDGMGLFGADFSKLTDAQKTDVTDAIKKIAGLQKELIGKMADAKAITQENKDSAIKKIDDQLANLDKTGITGNAKGLMNGFGCFNFGFAGMDGSALTADQKSILTDYSTKIADVQKDLINKMVTNGTITKDQGDASIKRIDEMLKSGPVNGFMHNGMSKENKGMMKDGQFRGRGGRGGSVTSGSAIQPAAGSI